MSFACRRLVEADGDPRLGVSHHDGIDQGRFIVSAEWTRDPYLHPGADRRPITMTVHGQRHAAIAQVIGPHQTHGPIGTMELDLDLDGKARMLTFFVVVVHRRPAIHLM